MARDKNLPEMFEAFRLSRGESLAPKSPTQTEKPTPKKPKEPEPPEKKPVPKPPKTPREPADSPEQAGYLGRTAPIWLRALMDSHDVHFLPLGQRVQVVVALSYHALIFAIIVFAVFSLLVGFIGHTIGSRPEGVVKPPPARRMGVEGVDDTATRGGTPARGGVVAPKEIHFRVQVLTVRNTPARLRALEEDMAFLSQPPNPVPDVLKRVNRRGDMVSLFAGAFGKDESKQAEELAKRLRLMKVPGRSDEFKGAKVVPVR